MKKYHFDDFMRVVRTSKMIPVVVIGYEVIGEENGLFKLRAAFEIHPNVKENPNMQDVVLGSFKAIEKSWEKEEGSRIVEDKK